MTTDNDKRSEPWCLHNNQNWDEHAAWNEPSTGNDQLAA